MFSVSVQVSEHMTLFDLFCFVCPLLPQWFPLSFPSFYIEELKDVVIIFASLLSLFFVMADVQHPAEDMVRHK